MALNNFLLCSNEEKQLDNHLVQSWDLTDRSRKNKLLNVMASSVIATTTAITDSVENRLKLWTGLQESRKVEKKLVNNASMPNEVRDVMTIYNITNSPLERRRLLSFLVIRYTFAFLSLFNGNGVSSADNCGDDLSSNDEDDEVATEVRLENPPDITWQPPLSQYVL